MPMLTLTFSISSFSLHAFHPIRGQFCCIIFAVAYGYPVFDKLKSERIFFLHLWRELRPPYLTLQRLSVAIFDPSPLPPAQ